MVTVLLVVLSAMVAPSLLGSQRRNTLSVETQQLAEAARYAQRMAVLKGRPLRLVITPTDAEHQGRSSYRLELANTDIDSSDGQPFEELRSGVVKPRVLESVLRIGPVQVYSGTPAGDPTADASGVYAVTFYADGSADAASIGLGLDTAGSGDAVPQRAVVIEASTGRVSVSDGVTSGPPAVWEDLDE